MGRRYRTPVIRPDGKHLYLLRLFSWPLHENQNIDFISIFIWVFTYMCMYVCIVFSSQKRASEPLKDELQIVGSLLVGTGNQTWVLCSSKWSYLWSQLYGSWVFIWILKIWIHNVYVMSSLLTAIFLTSWLATNGCVDMLCILLIMYIFPSARDQA